MLWTDPFHHWYLSYEYNTQYITQDARSKKQDARSKMQKMQKMQKIQDARCKMQRCKYAKTKSRKQKQKQKTKYADEIVFQPPEFFYNLTISLFVSRLHRSDRSESC
jgi:hypothetical protein